MTHWPLSETQWDRLSDALTSKFGKSHDIGLICNQNAGYVAYSESIGGRTRTTINIAETEVLSIITDEYTEPFAEHEYLHVHGVGTQKLATLNPPDITRPDLRDFVRNVLTEHVLDLAKCTNVIFQQEMAKEYVEFECRKFEYIFSRDKPFVRAAKFMTYGYLDALSKHFGVRCFMSRERIDMDDLAIQQSAETLIAMLLRFRKNSEDVNLFDLCVNLDRKIRNQKKI